ncbi:MAG: TetR/AcrR family transcriptional regulator [Desulfobacterales bacterium]|nr:TetR/AcrR family transcriptional regulator [Desulfobacterales bacterium]
MPPKIKFTREMILDTALEMVRAEGWPSLTARNIAKRLNSSVGPIYSILNSMGALEEELIRKVVELLIESMTTPRTDDQILNIGLGYIVFARDERQLFKCFIEEKYAARREAHREKLWRRFGAKFIENGRYGDLTHEEIEQHRKKMFVFTYGLAVMINTGSIPERLNDEEIVAILREIRGTLLAGLRAMKSETDNPFEEGGEE